MSQDAFSHHDAAYVLGALSPADRQAFEDHLESCESCRRAVGDVAGLPGLLARVDPADLERGGHPVGDPVPDTLLPRLLGEVRRTQRRRRAWVASAAAAAAAVAAVSVGVTVVGNDRSPETSASPDVPAQVMTPLDRTPLSAKLAIEDVAWGTRLSITCTYTQGRYEQGELPAYALVVNTRDGSEQVATWRAVAGKTTTVVAATASPSAEITSVEVRTTGGDPVLRLAG